MKIIKIEVLENGHRYRTLIDLLSRDNYIYTIENKPENNQVQAVVIKKNAEGLLPCPFCGEPKWLYVRELAMNDYLIECANCHIDTPPFIFKKDAKAFWNKRI